MFPFLFYVDDLENAMDRGQLCLELLCFRASGWAWPKLGVTLRRTYLAHLFDISSSMSRTRWPNWYWSSAYNSCRENESWQTESHCKIKDKASALCPSRPARQFEIVWSYSELILDGMFCNSFKARRSTPFVSSICRIWVVHGISNTVSTIRDRQSLF